ncbi:MAG: response regulator [Caldithrix sp.]|nr:response regulator [Caldithrix sp.]
MTHQVKLLLIDDEEDARYLLETALEGFGFDITTAADGIIGMHKLEEHAPDIVLLDLNMPDPDGHEVCKRIKADPRFMNLPIIILTSSDDLNDKLGSFEEGADEYITKEMDPKEMEKRIHAVLNRYRRSLDSNPLTRLPGNNAIQHILQKRIEASIPIAVGYCDLDNFKAYNDAYGFMKGDEIILFTANVIQKAVKHFGGEQDFIGHIGGDDFIFLTSPGVETTIAEAIIAAMDKGISQFYKKTDQQRGYIVATNRQGNKEKFPLISVSIAIVSNKVKRITSIAQVSKIAGELKKLAKQKTGNSYVYDKRQD